MKHLPSPWDSFQPWDIRQFGEVILDRKEQERWARALFLGGLTYMWQKADVMRELIYDKLAVSPGDRVLIIGEAVEGSGFGDDLRHRVGPRGEVRVIDITEEARGKYWAGVRGSGGQLATWEYTYTHSFAEESFDCVAVLQGVQHAEDWQVAGKELLRVMRSGRRIVLAEIAFGPNFAAKVAADVHIEYLFEKLFERVGWRYQDFPYYSPSDLRTAFASLVTDANTFEWRGIELFWGTKP